MIEHRHRRRQLDQQQDYFESNWQPTTEDSVTFSDMSIVKRHDKLDFIYSRMILHSIKSVSDREIDEKTVNRRRS
jgi:hypothetical protein